MLYPQHTRIPAIIMCYVTLLFVVIDTRIKKFLEGASADEWPQLQRTYTESCLGSFIHDLVSCAQRLTLELTGREVSNQAFNLADERQADSAPVQ